MARTDRPALPAVSPPAFAVRSANATIRSVERLQRGLTLPLLRVLGQTVAMAEVQATTAFAALGVADHLEDGPRSAEELAAEVGCDADKLERLLEFLATRGIVSRHDGRFALTASSDLLRRGHPDSVRDWVLFQGSDWQWGAWAQLAEGVRSGTTPFELAHGRSYFDHLTAEAAAGAQFDAAMRSTSRLQGQLLARALDLDGVSTLCDVGGGTGSVLAQLLDNVPGLKGVLCDLPAVCERAGAVLEEAGVTDRVTVEPGDMFDSIPSGHDRYLLSAIIHDWDDDAAVEILANLRTAMSPNARAFIVELELPDHAGASLERAYDLLMLVLGGGRERSRSAFEDLYARAGLQIVDDHLLDNGWHAHELAVA